MSWFQFLTLSGIVKCVTKSLNHYIALNVFVIILLLVMSSLLITQFWILCDHLGHLKTLGDFGRLLDTLRPERQKVLRAEQGPCDTINANPTSTLAYIWTKGLDKQGVQYIFIAIYNRDGRQVNHNTIILGCTALTQCTAKLHWK